MTNAKEVETQLKQELANITDAKLLQAIERWRIKPRCEFREWDYGTPGQAFACWIVWEHTPSNTAIAFCNQGFGPTSPWGKLFLNGPNLTIGMDSSWFSYFEDALRASNAWDGENPVGYEVR